MAHKGHPGCPFTSKAKCEAARREAIGHCIAMLDENRQCPNWGTDTVDGRAYCGQHIRTVYLAANDAKRRAVAKAELDRMIDEALEWRRRHPSVWDPLPDVPWTPLLMDPQPREEDIHWTSEAVGIDTVTGATVRLTDRGYEELQP